MFLGNGWPDWQMQSKDAALSELTADSDLAPVQHREAAGQGQTQPGALLLPTWPRVDLMKLLEQMRLIRLRDADSRVGNRNFDRRMPADSRDRHLAVIGRALDGIGGKVKQHLLQLAGIRENIPGRSRVSANRDPFLAGQGLDRAE